MTLQEKSCLAVYANFMVQIQEQVIYSDFPQFDWIFSGKPLKPILGNKMQDF